MLMDAFVLRIGIGLRPGEGGLLTGDSRLYDPLDSGLESSVAVERLVCAVGSDALIQETHMHVRTVVAGLLS